jgi:FMN reductase
MNILHIIASPRIESLSAKGVHFIHDDISAHQRAQSSIIDLRQTPLPLYMPDSFHVSEHYEEIQQQVINADAYIVATPDYHGSMSGMLKNFFDYFWKEFAGKLFASVCASHERGVTATEQIRTVVRQCYAWSLPYYICVNEDSFSSKDIFDEAVQSRLRMMARDISVYGRIIAEQKKVDSLSSENDMFMAHYRADS